MALVNNSARKKNPHTTAIDTKYAPNANHEEQLKFHSTRNTNKRAMNKLAKPSKEELTKQRLKLGAEIPNFCGICLKENDEGGSDTISWI